MAEAVLDNLSNITRMLASLKLKADPEERGVVGARGNVIKDDNRISPSLNSQEKSRLKESAEIIGKVLKVGAFKEGPEAQRLEDLTVKAPKLENGAGRAVKEKMPKEKKGFSLLDTILGLFGLLSFANLRKKAIEFLTKRGRVFFSWLGRNIWSGVKWALSQIWSGIKWATSKIWGGVKWLGGKVKGASLWLGNKILTWATGLIDNIKGSEFYKNIMQTFDDIKNGLKGLWDNVINGIKGFVDDLVAGLVRAKDFVKEAVKKIPGYNLAQKAAEKVSTAARAVTEKVAVGAQKVSTAARTVGTKATEIGTKAVAAVKDTAKEIIEAGKKKIASYTDDFFKAGLGSAGRTLGGFLRKLPVIGPIIEGLFAASDIRRLKEQQAKGEIDIEELKLKAGKRVVTGVTGMGGAALGAAAGTSIGGPVGALVGGVGGDILGRYLGDLLIDKFVSADITKKLGEYVIGGDTSEEMQDFIVKSGKVYKFNAKDELLGMKSGGAIEGMVNDLATAIATENKAIRAATESSARTLHQIYGLLQTQGGRPMGSSSTSLPQPIPNKVLNFREKNNILTQIPVTERTL